MRGKSDAERLIRGLTRLFHWDYLQGSYAPAANTTAATICFIMRQLNVLHVGSSHSNIDVKRAVLDGRLVW